MDVFPDDIIETLILYYLTNEDVLHLININQQFNRIYQNIIDNDYTREIYINNHLTRVKVEDEKTIQIYTTFEGLKQGWYHQYLKRYSVEIPVEICYYEAGVLNGSYFHYSYKDDYIETGQFKNGKKTGEWKYYFNTSPPAFEAENPKPDEVEYYNEEG